MSVNRDFIPENASVEEKLDVIADEVLDILKQISRDSSKKLSSKVISECLFRNDSVKKIIEYPEAHSSNQEKSTNTGKQSSLTFLSKITETIMERFSEFASSFLSSQFAYLNDQYQDKTIFDDAYKWLNSSFKILNKYFQSITSRIGDLQQFIVDTMRYINETEEHVVSELNSIQQTYNENNDFAQKLSMNIKEINQNLDEVSDLKALKKRVLGTIGNINACIDEKSKMDMQRLKDKEKKLQSLGGRLNDIKKEADVLKEKAEKLEQESLLDDLTGVNNRKAYDNKVTELIAAYKLDKVPFSLLLCDIDKFQQINDVYGHNVGDLALKKFAVLLKEELTATDFIARYGGELFAVILPHTSLNKAKEVAEKVRGFIYKSTFSYKKNHIQVTVSIGISTFRKDDDAGSVFERADRSLYLAKHSGRNIVKTEEQVLQESDSYIMTSRK